MKIQPNEEIFPKIYAYSTPEIAKNIGWLKIGYTEKNVERRVKEQTHTAQVDAKIEWSLDAFFIGTAKIFTDKIFHRFLTHKKFVKRRPNTEWFKIDADTARKYLEEFRSSKEKKLRLHYELRDEQFTAVNLTLKYFLNGGKKFLWNAKPRFGKTLAAYDLARKLHAQKILIVTNRPAISNSWKDDFEKFIEHQTDYKFISANYENFFDKPIIAFESLQNLKGAKIFGGDFDKLNCLEKFQWDLLIVDESHEGVDTQRTQELFQKISRRWTLYLSGTPFKALANNFFSTDEIFNWSYADEQRAKISWTGDSANPYADLPQMNLFSYQLSKIIIGKVNRGVEIGAEHYDYAFDLNEFFSTHNGKFIHEGDVKKFLDALTTHEKFPFSTENLRAELKHTFWLFHRIDSVKAMKKILESHAVFKNYKIVDATGQNADDSGFKKSLDKVKKAIKLNDKTITLSVGQLTTGVTIPEWSAVFMLSNLRSAAEYFQAAFRAQNPRVYKIGDKTFHKKNCYVFDFAPERTLKIYNEFANNLNPARTDRQKNIGELLNFFPVLAEDDKGFMTPLDAETVLSLPQLIKARAVVDSCFMSNFLFVNVGKVFSNPRLRDIVYKFTPDDSTADKKIRATITKTIQLDENGNVKVKDTDANFGRKIYSDDVKKFAAQIIDDVKETFNFDDNQVKKYSNLVQKKIDATFTEGLENIDSATRQKFVAETATEIKNAVAKDIKRTDEDILRAHLRGFARTIPSFIMAYGGDRDNLKLKNFDENISDEIFLEVTGVTKNEFHELRPCFDEIIFNAAVKDFLQRKRELAEYFSHNHAKDIFDLIPPQRTNQIFTPRKIVVEMLDALEKIHPNIFDDPNQKFIDLYMKSGMFIAEIVKRLFNSKKLRQKFPTNRKRLEHILTRQVYGFAPTEIIYRIVTEYLFGAKFTHTIPKNNFICADTSKAVSGVNLRDFLQKYFSTAVFKLVKSKERVQKFGEVFTPERIVCEMLGVILEQVADIHTKILEPTFGEGIFLTEILSRRLENCHDESEILTALSNLYGVELQADNVQTAKKNIHKLIDDKVSDKNLAAQIIDANFLQGDFLSRKNSDGDTIFFRNWEIPSGNFSTFTIDDVAFHKNFQNFSDFIIVGNPPYQEDARGGNKTYAPPIYHKFLREFYNISDEVLMIHPARFLFNAGGTPKDFNKKMLADPHLKVVKYFANAAEVFDNVDIKGGVVITYRNANENFGAIGTFTAFPELNSILHKIGADKKDFQPLNKIMLGQMTYRLSQKAYEDFPDLSQRLPNRTDTALRTNAFEIMPDIFLIDKPNDGHKYFGMHGRYNNERAFRWVRREYMVDISDFYKYKIFVPAANGSGALGETVSTMLVGSPLVGSTQTFISVGAFDTRAEAEACIAYIKGKFCRAMLGVLKVTQHNPPDTWAKVPLQDFTSASDIDWTKSVAEIDAQLYKKYGLTDDEINFIEDHVKVME